MKDGLKVGAGIVIGYWALALIGLLALMGIAAVCLFCFGGLLLVSAPGTPTSQPTPNALGQSVVYHDLKVTVVEYQFSGAYKDKYGTDQKPPEQAKFLWLHASAENVGQTALDAPNPFSFQLVYKGTHVSANYPFTDRVGYSLYQGGQIYPGVRTEGWIRFDLPADAQAADIKVQFQPSLSAFPPVYFFWQLGH